MAKYKTESFELQDDSDNALVDLNKVGPNTLLMITSDFEGNKKVLKIDAGAIRPDQTVLRNSTDGLCYKLINGVWRWVPC